MTDDKKVPEDEEAQGAKEEKVLDNNTENSENADAAKPEANSDEPPKDNKPEKTPAPVTDDKDGEILRLKTQIAAMQLGVKPDCTDDAVAIAESYVKSGTAADINSALSAVVKKYPDMKSDNSTGQKKQSGGFRVGVDSDTQKDKSSSDSKLSQAFGIKKKGMV